VTWVSDDGRHEGWAAAEFPDGRVSTAVVGGAGVAVRTIEEAASAGPRTRPPAAVIDGGTAIGWRGLCTCGWTGPLWRRTPLPPAHSPALHTVYADPGRYASPPDGTEAAIGEEWRGHLPPPELVAVAAAAGAARTAAADLDDAVRRAHASGASWAAIGAAAGMSRQAANERWGKHRLPAATGDGQDQ
jgi:hypothetical protein